MNDFYAAMFQANLLFGLDIKETDFEEIGLIAWNHIGNKQTVLYNITLDIDHVTKSVELPCNVDIIESVTYTYEDWNYTSNKYAFGDYDSQFTEHHIEVSKKHTSPFYQSGKFAKYQQVGNVLHFSEDYGKVNILYHGVLLDESGLPKLTDNEVLAIATYCAYVKAAKEYYVTLNRVLLEKMQILKQQWDKSCDRARLPMKINQNDMNRVLDARSNWNRKIFNKSFKPII